MRFRHHYRIELAPTLAGHYYTVFEKKKFLGYFVSSTTILNAYPQSVQLTRWIADKGWHESQAIKSEAGERGTKVHNGVDLLLGGKVLAKNAYSLEEWWRLNAFVQWHKDYHPQLMASNLPVFSKKHGYCGTLDRLYRIQKKVVLVDDKTSGAIYDHFPLQVGSYAEALEEMAYVKVDETAILQLGAKNKNTYRFALYPEWRDHFKVFLSVFGTWKYDNGVVEGFEPPVLVLPEELKL